MIDIAWRDAERRIMTIRFHDGWTWQEFHDIQKQMNAMIDQVEGIVDCIMFTSPTQHIPPQAVNNFKEIIHNRHARLERVILISAKPFLVMMLRFIVGFIPAFAKQLQFVSNQEQALQLIYAAQQMRANHLET